MTNNAELIPNIPSQPARVTVSYSHKVKPSLLPQVKHSREIFEILLDIWENHISGLDYHESFVVIFMNRANKVIGWELLSTGGTAGVVADPKMIFQAALLVNAASIAVSHNHPSGALKPSDADIKLTKKIVEVGNVLEMPVLDHIIMTSEGYYSFADEAML